jgi:uncharacterized protein YbaR (Trm112 family)
MTRMALDSRLLSVLACPQDKGRLRRKYLVRDGIPVMLIDEAVAASDAEHDEIMARIESAGLTPTFAA